MKASSIASLRRSLGCLDHDELIEACLRLARFKAENKQLLTYFLEYSADELGYASRVCEAVDEEFPQQGPIHKKTLRRIVRLMNQWTRFSGNKETELQVRIHFCRRYTERRGDWTRCRVKANLYAGQIRKINQLLNKVHPDLQFDFRCQMDALLPPE